MALVAVLVSRSKEKAIMKEIGRGKIPFEFKYPEAIGPENCIVIMEAVKFDLLKIAIADTNLVA